MSTDHAKFMALAIEESRKGLRAGERPFGAVVVRGDEIVARAYSVVESSGDPTSHAETRAVRAATARSWNNVASDGQRATASRYTASASLAFPASITARAYVD